MRRTSITIAAAVAAAASIAVIATSGSAQVPTVTSLHLTGTAQKTVGFFPNHGRPRQGDRFGFGDTITGDDTGVDRGVCTVIGSSGVCTVQVNLAHGTLTAQGTTSLSHPNKNTPYAINGGTGAYNGARGTALVTDSSSKTTDIQISLLP